MSSMPRTPFLARTSMPARIFFHVASSLVGYDGLVNAESGRHRACGQARPLCQQMWGVGRWAAALLPPSSSSKGRTQLAGGIGWIFIWQQTAPPGAFSCIGERPIRTLRAAATGTTLQALLHVWGWVCL